MIVVDTSVAVAMIRGEPDTATWVERLRRHDALACPASCYLEAAMVLRVDPGGRGKLENWLRVYAISILGSDARQARLAADAFARYGRGSGHPARLNFGDCLAYAAAAAHRAPLLFKGQDFAETDVARVEAS